MKTLVGSQALKNYIPNVTPKDIDYFSDSSIKGAETFYHPDLEKWNWNDVASLDELYTIKVSHSFWNLKNGSWAKHMKGIMLMSQHGAQFIPELYAILYPIWEEIHGKKRVNLNVTADEFFNANITRMYEHDSIHQSIAYYEEPLFNAILVPGSDVAVSRDRFEDLSFEDKLNLIREEVMATALERQVIASDGKNWRSAYAQSLKANITSYSKGWFPLFIVLNFEKLNTAPFNYYEKMMNNKDCLILS